MYNQLSEFSEVFGNIDKKINFTTDYNKNILDKTTSSDSKNASWANFNKLAGKVSAELKSLQGVDAKFKNKMQFSVEKRFLISWTR